MLVEPPKNKISHRNLALSKLKLNTDRNKIHTFSKHWPSGPMLSISRNVRLSVRVSVCLSVYSLLRYRLNIFWSPLPRVGCPIFLEIRNPWGKVVERSGLRFEHFCLNCLKSPHKKKFFLTDFALQNIVETTLPDGLEISGRRGVSLILAYL